MFYYLSLAAALFAIGLYGVFARGNLPGKIISFFIMFNAIIINFAAFNKFVQGEGPTGLVFIVFILLIFGCQISGGALLFYQWRSQSRASAEDNLHLLK